LCGPLEFLPEVALTLSPRVSITRRLEEAVSNADVVMMLRVQKERLVGLEIDVERYIAHFQLTTELLRMAKRNALVMHPGPMIRGMEIQSEVADSGQSVVEEQVHNGVYVRMAVLAICTGVAS
jgi:aspartate carbamoyltransferase catalytic subunit